MARTRSDVKKRLAKEKIHFPHENTIVPTGLVAQKAIYRPQCNTWFKRVHVDEEDCYYPHPCIFLLLPARRPRTKEVKATGKGAHRQLPKRYLEQIEKQEQQTQQVSA